MILCDNQDGKKMVELEHLMEFLFAYEVVTNTSLTPMSGGESPDFLCVRESGATVGVELARSPHDYERAIDDRIWTDLTMPTCDLLEAVHSMVAQKAEKLKKPFWRTPQNTILVVELLDYSFENLRWTAHSMVEDFAEYGFEEIWISDHSTKEAYGQVRLIGLYPAEHWGLGDQPQLDGKPFG